MSQARHQEIEKALDGYVARELVDRYDWDEQGARYLVWIGGAATPTVFTLMATEAFIKGVTAADAFHARTRPAFVAESTGDIHRVRNDVEVHA